MDAIAQVSKPVFLVAAYGRKYQTKSLALKDWYSGMDFKIVNGPYCSVRDLNRLQAMRPSGIYLQLNNELINLE